jgi:16S rRNA (guanine966-N2)-methyltransferase
MADAGRVIAGRARGRRLRAPGEGTRPLGDRVKQTLFAILEPDLRGAAVLDLFAGSGAAGIEALSRGAARVVFVDRDQAASRTIESNLEATDLAGPAAIVRRTDAVAYVRTGAPADDGPFDIVFLDPPYTETALLLDVLVALGGPPEGDGPRLAPGARVVAKHFWRDAPPARVGLLASERERRFGETGLTFYRREESR